MANIKEYSYQEKITIKLRYYPSNSWEDGGWHWECFADGKSLCDSLKNSPCSSETRAIEDAKEEVDWLLDIDSEEMPVLIEEPPK